MINEQREAIEAMQHWIEYEKEHKDEINKADELIRIQDTVLSLIKEQQEELKKQDRQIDLMAEYIEKVTVDLKVAFGENMLWNRNEIKQYFADLAEKEN